MQQLNFLRQPLKVWRSTGNLLPEGKKQNFQDWNILNFKLSRFKVDAKLYCTEKIILANGKYIDFKRFISIKLYI